MYAHPRRQALVLLPALLLLSTCCSGADKVATAKAEKYAASWHAVDSLIRNGLTQSAMDTTGGIYSRAKAGANADQMVKAIIYRMRLESYKEEDAFVKALDRLNEELKTATFPVAPVLHSMLAECYWHYYQDNRWLFYNRTQTVGFDLKDVHTWDLKTIIERMTAEYEASLTDPVSLKKSRLDLYGEAIVDTGDAAKLRPTLYDFLAHRAVDFFSTDDVDLPKPASEFTLNSEDYFRPFADFARLTITTQDTASQKFHAIRILQDLIAFHAGEGDPAPLIDADLKRLAFVRRHAVLADKDSLYLEALQSLEKRFGGRPASAEVSFAIASLYHEWAGTYQPHGDDRYRWMNRGALALCDRAARAFPQSYGGRQCAGLAATIRAKSMDFEIEGVNLPGAPFRALVTCRNVPAIHWRQVKVSPDEYRRLTTGHYDERLVARTAQRKPLREWSTAVPDPGDFQSHSLEVELPALPLGHYVVLAASDSQFSREHQAVAVAATQISAISWVQRQQTDGSQELYLLHRTTGAPLKGVSVGLWRQEYDEKAREYKNVHAATLVSDQEGHVLVPATSRDYTSYSVEFIDGDDRLLPASQIGLYRYGREPRSMKLRTFFFTDRAIYRPGQTVYFNAIVLRTDGEKNAIAAGTGTVVRLHNVHGKEVAHLDLTTNAYGSVHGSFTAPSGTLNGRMRICDGHGQVYLSVEDYKRPKFEVLVDPFKGTSRLGESVTLRGQAKAYAGAAIDGAKVKYRVTRSARFPNWWWCWWRSPRWSSNMEIASGTGVTNDTGGFSVEFQAIPDLSIPRSEQPTFNYTVAVDVTDMTGETRSASGHVNVGYVSLALSVDVPQEVNRESGLAWHINTANLNGTFEPAKGDVTVHRLKAPTRVLRQRRWSMPDTAVMTQARHDSLFPGDLYADETNVSRWEKVGKLLQTTFDTQNEKELKLGVLKQAEPGAYVLETTTRDQSGQQVKDVRYFTLYSGRDSSLPYVQPDWFVPVKAAGEPGDTAVFLVGSAYEDVRVLYEVEHKGEIVSKEWLSLSNSQKRLEIPIEEKHRGNLAMHLTFVRDNRSYQHSSTISVPWTNKQLSISFETYRNNLWPGQKEEWRLKIAGANKDKVAAEMVAALYDASLDAFRPNRWAFSIYPSYWARRAWSIGESFREEEARLYAHDWNERLSSPTRYYPQLSWFGYSFAGGRYGGRLRRSATMGAIQSGDMEYTKGGSVASADVFGEGGFATSIDAVLAQTAGLKAGGGGGVGRKGVAGIGYGAGYGSGFGGGAGGFDELLTGKAEERTTPDLSTIATRTNLNETAFFFPDLQTNANGELIIKFQMPEALTRWRMLGFAHTQDLRFGQVTNELVTQKDLMVVPNPPRFFRENDRITFTAKVSNLSDKELTGAAQLMLFDAMTNKPADSAFANTTAQVSFTAKKSQSAPLAWNLSIPEGMGAVTFKVVAKAGDFSDGEEQTIPVLSNRTLVTESMPLPIRKKETKKFTFEKLLSQNNGSTTLRNHRLTLEFTSNPAWYAIQALPYLMEYPYECAEQTFARFYANSIAASMANASPRIKAVFDTWREQQPEALLSNLEKNQELKSLVLEETPWLLDGKSESERKKRVALLFDLNRMGREQERALTKLKKLQLASGGWPWFEGMPDDRYITQYIAIGLGRLDHLKMVDLRKDRELWNMMQRCLRYLDDRTTADYDDIMRHEHPDSNHLSATHVQYLYTRSYFTDVPVTGRNQKAYDYFMGQARKYWLAHRRYTQGMIALALNRRADKATPPKIMRSLKENALVSEEMGMYWKEMYEGSSWWWYEAPIETQALMVEAFDEVAHDTTSVEDLKAWLLKSKQTRNWQTTRATAEACYALLLRGANWLARPASVTIALGDVTIDAKKPKDAAAEAGTGYFKTSWSGADIKPAMGNISVSKQEAGVAWGAVYWQYFEQLDRITPHETPLKLNRALFLEVNSATGPRITPITEKTALKPGDKVKARIELRVDRDMEYVHMKDTHAAGFEPLNVFSGCRRQDGLSYYESTRDAATNFFFGFLGKGTYVFEYPLVVTHAGDFSSGITTIQCMYAPEFTSHSQGLRVKVGR